MDLTPIFKQIDELRHPEDGCPWDRKQTLDDYGESLIDEARELIEALEQGDTEAIREEAGDLLWNLCFVIRLGEERGVFSRQEIRDEVMAKMTRRHPHVYGTVKAETEAEALAAFKAAKAAEKDSPAGDASDS